MTLTEYSQLKEEIIFSVASSALYEQLLASLKGQFKQKINSVRRYEIITSIRDLLAVLEIRDSLSEDDVSSLKLIVGHLPNNKDLLHKINKYEENHVPRQQTNYYAPVSSQGLGSEIHDISKQINISSNPYTSNMSPKKKQRIFGTIIAGIGVYWRDLGRNLNIQEGMIDEIDINTTGSQNKVMKLLEYYDHNKADPQRWFYHICEALENARRKDLSKELQNIMTMNL